MPEAFWFDKLTDHKYWDFLFKGVRCSYSSDPLFAMFTTCTTLPFKMQSFQMTGPHNIAQTHLRCRCLQLVPKLQRLQNSHFSGRSHFFCYIFRQSRHFFKRNIVKREKCDFQIRGNYLKRIICTFKYRAIDTLKDTFAIVKFHYFFSVDRYFIIKKPQNRICNMFQIRLTTSLNFFNN